MTRITERELILPTLYLIRRFGELSTTDLINQLTDIFQPSGEDAEILAGRNDTKFSQIVRNLVAHHTIDQYGLKYVHYERRDNGYHRITKLGEEFLLDNHDNLIALFENRFAYPELLEGLNTIHEGIEDQNKKVIILDEHPEVIEGRRKFISTRVIERSSQLRNSAIEYYSHDGHIECDACNFDFWDFYGNLGRNFIEIHHIRPVCEYQGEERFSLEDALQLVAPLCSNCHRMVHRTRGMILSVKELQEIIHAVGK